MSPDHLTKLYRLWHDGTSLQQTAIHMRRAGVQLSHEQIRRFFIRFCNGYRP